jgi:hypothetical protein
MWLGSGGCNRLCPAATGLSLVTLFSYPCRLRTDVALDSRSSHRYIVLSTYLLMGAGRLVALLSWVPALSGPTVRGGF